jgi:hypothetical protein
MSFLNALPHVNHKGISKTALVYDHLSQFSKSPVKTFSTAAASQNLEKE